MTELIMNYYVTVKDELDLHVSSWINLRSQILNEQKCHKSRYSMIPIMKVLQATLYVVYEYTCANRCKRYHFRILNFGE